nr:MAG TPA: hypothetical protein [Caudoviricetes sp.]
MIYLAIVPSLSCPLRLPRGFCAWPLCCRPRVSLPRRCCLRG